MIGGSRPVVNAGRTLGAVAAIAGLVPILGGAFGWFTWTADQLEAYTVAVGGVVGALALFLGVNVEKQVTPTSDPKDDAGNSLTPGPIGGDQPAI
ncbi:MAG: hypothetical protein U9N84_07610 [Actinomycetota bacterium]|nr:hypothetical protein [Actinomycetota bacterium]